jgi:hypothetical protein
MRRAIRISVIGAGTVAGLFSMLVWYKCGFTPFAAVFGGMAARWDVSRGHYQVLGYGLPVPWRFRYAELMEKKYGVKFHAVAGCIVSQSTIDYVDAYDDVSESAIRKKFGPDVVRAAAEQAETEWNQRVKENSSETTPGK